jgi:hypothetical protein
MQQEDPSSISQAKPPSPPASARFVAGTQAYAYDRTCETMNATPFFPVTDGVRFKPMTPVSERGAGHLPPEVARLVSLLSLGALLLGPLSGCGSTTDSSVPCAVPSTTATPVAEGTPTANCTTSSGAHYLWIRSRGGWVTSNDGVHPNANAQGVGADEENSGTNNGHSSSGTDEEGHSSSGVGEGHASAGHAGGEGG